MNFPFPVSIFFIHVKCSCLRLHKKNPTWLSLLPNAVSTPYFSYGLDFFLSLSSNVFWSWVERVLKAVHSLTSGMPQAQDWKALWRTAAREEKNNVSSASRKTLICVRSSSFVHIMWTCGDWSPMCKKKKNIRIITIKHTHI